MDNKTKLEYALKLKRLHEIMVVKENLYFAHQNANYNRAAYHIDKIVDKHLEEHIINTVDGTISLTNHENKLDKIMSTTLTNQRKRVLKKTNRYIDKAVENNINTYSNFLKNRINKESISLANKIEQEAKKKQYKHLTDTETKKILQEKFSNHGRRRAKNILRDALHANQSNISWIHGIQQGYKYKIWMNGAGKGRVRLWHRAKKIQPVHMDEFFDIYGSYHATMMYPGDLNGGAENVANCRCWLNYTNQKPQELKTRGTFTISNNVELKPTDKPKTKTKNITIKQETTASEPKPPKPKITEKIKTTLRNLKNKIKNKFRFNKPQDNYEWIKHTTSDGKRTIKVREVKDSKEFKQYLEEAYESQPKKACWRVDLDYSPDDYIKKGCKMYVTENGSTIAIKPDGDIISVCSKLGPNGEHDNARALLEFAVKKGGTKFDSYDGNYGFYRRCGFEPCTWTKGNPEYYPDLWKENHKKGKEGFDEEDIIFFKYTGKQSKYTEVEEFKEANKDKCLEYDDAYDKRDELMKHET